MIQLLSQTKFELHFLIEQILKFRLSQTGIAYINGNKSIVTDLIRDQFPFF